MRMLRVAAAVGFGLSLAAAPAFAATPPAKPATTPAPKPAAPTAAAPQARAAPTAPATLAVQPEAVAAVRKMSAYLSSLNTFELTSKTSLDIVTVQGQRVQLDGVVNYKVRRPDSFVIKVDSDLKKRAFFYDGKNFTVYAPELGYYATVAAPSTIRATLGAINDKFGIQLPLEDLFRWNDPGEHREEALTSAFTVGTATLDGVETDQYAFRQADVDWQIWIQRGAQPLPLKVVIVDKSDPANPAYTARLTWTVNPTLTADDFAFRPGKDAKSIRLTQASQ